MDAMSAEREIQGMAISWTGKFHSSCGCNNCGFASTRTYGTCSVSNSWMACTPARGWRKIVIADQQQRGYPGLGEANDAPTPLTLEGRRRRAVFISIAREDDHVHTLIDGRIDDRVQRLQKIEHAQRQARFRIVPPVIAISICVIGKMKNSHRHQSLVL